MNMMFDDLLHSNDQEILEPATDINFTSYHTEYIQNERSIYGCLENVILINEGNKSDFLTVTLPFFLSFSTDILILLHMHIYIKMLEIFMTKFLENLSVKRLNLDREKKEIKRYFFVKIYRQIRRYG